MTVQQLTNTIIYPPLVLLLINLKLFPQGQTAVAGCRGVRQINLPQANAHHPWLSLWD